MKYWKYTNYNEVTKTTPISDVYKDPYVKSLTSPGSDYVEVSIPKTLVPKNYSKHRDNGALFYDNQRDEYIMLVSDGSISFPDAQYLASSTKIITDAIQEGNWHDGYNYALLLVADVVLTQVIIDKLISDIKNYINNNYPQFLNV